MSRLVVVNLLLDYYRMKNQGFSREQPVSALSTVKLEKQCREFSLKQGQDPEICITQLEDLRVKLDNMGSCITENHFMIHIY
jgi:hypothetical protein